MSEGDVIKTGIKGLDSILLGGIPRTNVIVLQGVTGSGKTLMGMEFIYRGITEYNEPGLIVVFETSPDKLIRDAAGFGWNLNELQQAEEAANHLYQPAGVRSGIAFARQLAARNRDRDGRPTNFRRRHWVVQPCVGEQRPHRWQVPRIIAAIDGVVEPRESDGHAFARTRQRTADSVATAEMADFLADTVIQLGRERHGRRMQRSLEIVKSRGQDYETGEHTLQITSGQRLGGVSSRSGTSARSFHAAHVQHQAFHHRG